ncbi:MAG: flippase-like domain-containing protein [Candidatus Micrarchaeota archaeon]|nr:flippase-like domain-containing protein [Candidatus Micrarchaeota archaeon]
MAKSNQREAYRKKVRDYQKILFLILFFSFIVFVVIAAFGVYSVGVGRFISSVESIRPSYFLQALGIVFVSYLLRFPKWQLYMKRLGIRIKAFQNLIIYLSMYSMDITPGRWGRAIGSYTINRLTGAGIGTSFPAVVADIFTDFVGFAIVAVAAALLVRQYIEISIGASLLLFIPFIFLYNKGAYSIFSRRLRKFKFLRGLFAVGDSYFSHNKKLGLPVYIYSLLCAIPATILNGLSLYFVMLAFGINVGIGDLGTIVFIYAVSTLLGMLTGLPANIGVTDATLLGFILAFFGGYGIDVGLAAIITIFTRIVNVWFVQLFGFGALLYTLRYWREK